MYNYGKKIIVWLFMFVLFFINVSNTFAARDIMDIIFQPAKSYDKIIDLGSTKNAVWNEVFREWLQVWANENFGRWCFVNDNLIPSATLKDQIKEADFRWDERAFCEQVLGWDYNISVLWSQTQAPLIVRITKFLLRLTIVLSITMVLYNWVFWIIESAKWWDVKIAKDNLIYIFVGILLALSSLALVNLISSITLSSLNPEDMPSQWETTDNTTYWKR